MSEYTGTSLRRLPGSSGVHASVAGTFMFLLAFVLVVGSEIIRFRQGRVRA